MNVPAQRGEHWADTSIHDILRNPVYISKIRWNWRTAIKSLSNGQINKKRPRNDDDCIIVDGLQKPVIDKDAWNLAQLYMSKNQPHPAAVIKNPLSGLVICGKCGRTMVRRLYNNRRDQLICYSPECI